MTNQDENVIGIQGEGHRQSILDAAEELFAEKGFTGTSIREITQQAKCNIASVNYYFHGKESAKYSLQSLPVWDGIVAANGQLYIATQDGTVTCMEPK